MPASSLTDTHFFLHDLKHPALRWSWLDAEAIHGHGGLSP
jgi:hypothetical protein